jgi:hypothetical protein
MRRLVDALKERRMHTSMSPNPQSKVVSANTPAPAPTYGRKTPPRPPLAWWAKLLPRRWMQLASGSSVVTSELPSASAPSKGVSVGRRNLAETMVGYGKPVHRAR